MRYAVIWYAVTSPSQATRLRGILLRGSAVLSVSSKILKRVILGRLFILMVFARGIPLTW